MNGAPSTVDVPGHHPWLDGVLSEREMLIVAGGYRCGTTSVFSHLAAHPEIDPSLIKEPAFFFSLRLNENPQVSYPKGHEAWAYLSMFRRSKARVLLEGTSNYLNDPGSAARIARALPGAKVVLLLREPVARLVSWYRFLRLQGNLAADVSFEQWIETQLADPRATEARPYPLQAVDHCRYARYVADYLRVLGRDRVLTVWFDDLLSSPKATLQRIATFAAIDPSFYDRYEFRRENESMQIRRKRSFALYRKLHRGLCRLLRPWPRLEHEFKVQLFGVVEPRLLPYFTEPAPAPTVPPALAQRLRRHFVADLQELQSLLGETAPWQREAPG